MTTVAGALERRCWTTISNKRLFPNVFVLLVAEPGIGKTVAIVETADLWTDSGAFNVAPMSMTKAAFIDQLLEKKKVVGGKFPEEYHAMLAPCDEFGVLVTAHDLAFLNTLNAVYDCNEKFEERTRSNSLLTIRNPHLCLIGGTQPEYLGATLPDTAWRMGFTSRIIMVYSGERVTQSLFRPHSKNAALRSKLLEDVQHLATMVGEFTWAPEVATALDAWHMAGGPPSPTHVRLQSYVARRTIHLTKLCIACSASRSDNMVIEMEDYERAFGMLLDAEATMPEIFKAMRTESDAEVIDECYNFIIAEYLRRNRPLRENMIVWWLSERVPAMKINFILETMVRTGHLSQVGPNTAPNREFKPIERHQLGRPEDELE